MNTEFGVCRLDVAFYRVDGEIKSLCNLLMFGIAVIHLHHAVLGIAQLGIESWHTDHTLQRTLPSQRTSHLLEIIRPIVINIASVVSSSPKLQRINRDAMSHL